MDELMFSLCSVSNRTALWYPKQGTAFRWRDAGWLSIYCYEIVL